MSGNSKRTDCPQRLHQEIEDLGPWFHNLHLPGGLETAPDHPLGDFPLFKWRQIEPHLPAELAGWRVLDIGCNAGFYTFELARRGAQVMGIDVNLRYLKQAQWAAARFDLGDRVEFRHLQVYDLLHVGETFDLVLFMGVFYHLRYPLLGLDIVSSKVRHLMLFQTLTMPGEEVYPDTYNGTLVERDALLEPGWPKMAFLEHHFCGDPTNWWVANHAGVEAMLRSSGMRVLGRPAHEIYLCEPDLEHPSCVTTWNEAELRSATGQPWHSHGRNGAGHKIEIRQGSYRTGDPNLKNTGDHV
jgi:tRNA (mo5U34)-methyltransferase